MSQFRLMTWNVENLFDVGDDDGPKTQAQFAAKIESLRAVIDAQRPHVLTLQEVGSESALAKLQAALDTVAASCCRGARRARDPGGDHQPAGAARPGRDPAVPGWAVAGAGR